MTRRLHAGRLALCAALVASGAGLGWSTAHIASARPDDAQAVMAKLNAAEAIEDDGSLPTFVAIGCDAEGRCISVDRYPGRESQTTYYRRDPKSGDMVKLGSDR